MKSNKFTVRGGWNGTRDFESIGEALDFVKRDSGNGVEFTVGEEVIVLTRYGKEFKLTEIRKNYGPNSLSGDDDWGR